MQRFSIISAVSLIFLLAVAEAANFFGAPSGDVVISVEFTDHIGCYKPCVENTLIISGCGSDDIQCLCEDEYYQSNLYECFYSQCDKRDLPYAQNLAISSCAKFNVQPNGSPNIVHKRESSSYGGSSSFAPRSSSMGLSSSGYFYAGVAATSTETSYFPAPTDAINIVSRLNSVGMNQCGQSCFYSKLSSSGCGANDLACICSSSYFNAVTDCMVDACYDQVPLAFEVRPALCS
ncbi:uncharacterized protein V1510DRAFT_427463 [Dipodascopsis tothii]|uniref:uncharacterized protein n=1 Tax=Dipodascopsis tothii TaxID=44089 RepID=UPI0034CEAE22